MPAKQRKKKIKNGHVMNMLDPIINMMAHPAFLNQTNRFKLSAGSQQTVWQIIIRIRLYLRMKPVKTHPL